MEHSQKLELERFISEHEASESSKKAYGTRYRRIIRGAGDYLPLKVPLHKASEEQLLEMIRLNVQDSKSPAELSVSLVSLAIMIRRLYKKPIGLLIEAQKDFADERMLDTKRAEEVLNNELEDISMKTLRDHMLEQFKKEDYVSYMINYLLLTYGVRNADLNVRLITDRDDLNDKQNFLYRPNKSSVQYIRNDYKTKTTYGTKNYVIKDKLFVKSFNALYDDGYDFLLSKKDKSQMSMGSVGAYVKKRTYPHETESHRGVTSVGLTESDIFKIIMREVKSDAVKKAFYLTSRGTSSKVVSSNYNLNPHKAKQ